MLSLGFFSRSNSGWMEDFVAIWVGLVLVMDRVADRLTSVMDGVTSQSYACQDPNRSCKPGTAGSHKHSSLATTKTMEGRAGQSERTSIWPDLAFYSPGAKII